MERVDGKRLAEAMVERRMGKGELVVEWGKRFDEIITVQSVYKWLKGNPITKNNMRKLEKLFEKPEGYFVKKVTVRRPAAKKKEEKKKGFGIFRR